MSQVSHFGRKCHKYNTVILPMSCLRRHYQEHLKTPQKTGFEEEKSFDKEYKSFSMEKTTQKSFLEGSAPLYTVRECQRSVPSFGGALQRSVPPFEGALAFLSEFWTVEGNQGRIPFISGVGWIRI
jgi:hypothetical protein